MPSMAARYSNPAIGLAGTAIAASPFAADSDMLEAVKPRIAPVACGQFGVRSPGVRYGKNVMPWQPGG